MVSIVVTTYNGEKYIIEQLDSIRMQTYSADEVLIYDDRSSDNTPELVKQYIAHYKLETWRYIENEVNKGYSRNFTDAMNSTSGEFIFLADQDDIWELDKVEKMLSIMLENPQIALLASNVVPFYTGTNPQKVEFERYSASKKLVHILNRAKWIKPISPGCSMCFRKELLVEYNQVWFNECPHDCMLWGIAVLNQTAYLFNEFTMRFRRHDNNTSSRSGHDTNYRLKLIKSEIEIISRMKTFQSQNGNSVIKKFLNHQEKVYIKRAAAIEKGSLRGLIILLPKIKYYPRYKLWITDVYYCLKRKIHK